MEIAISAAAMLLFFALNLPVAFAVLLAVFLYFFQVSDVSALIAVQRLVGAAENTTILAVPFFIMLGTVMNYTGITRRMLRLAEVLSGHLPGGLAHANVLLSTMMGGMSASNLADCAMLSKMLVPEMVKLGYSRAFSTAVTASGALITPIIPPGIALIIYGFVADVSIGKMFMAGILPGILCCLLLMAAVYYVAKKRGYKPAREHAPTLAEFGVAMKEAILALLLVVVILGGIRAGIFTPTEAGAVACIYVMVVGGLVYKEMKFEHVKIALIETARSTAGIMLIIMACSALAWILTWERVAQNVTTFVIGFTTDPYLFLMVINVFLLFLGMLLEGNAIIIVLVPLLMPTVKALGIDPIHFGLVLILNLAIGCLTPPMGTVMFVATNITKVSIADFIKEMTPFYIALAVALLLVTYIPWISTFIPNL